MLEGAEFTKTELARLFD